MYMSKWVFIALIVYYIFSCILVLCLSSIKTVIEWGVQLCYGPVSWALFTFLDPFGLIHEFLWAHASGEPQMVESLGFENNVLHDQQSATLAPQTSYPHEPLEVHLEDGIPQTSFTWKLSQGLLREIMSDPSLRSILVEYFFPGSIVVVGGYALTRRMKQLM